MVTSARPGDGKTFTTLNLAMSLAMEKDLRVLLVDADIPKPNVTTLFGLAGQRGLIDVLSDGDADPASIVCPTNVRGLYFVPAGRSSDVATELLSSGRMVSVVQRWVSMEPRLLVLFDSPPMLVTSESQALAAIMSQILVVVRAGVTLQSAVKDTLAVLSGGSGQLSLVLNDAPGADPLPYGYGYGYGQTQSPQETTNAS
jgi:receptor protein-tyrosine kinase